MADLLDRWDIKPADYGPLWKYVNDDNISDVTLNCNGRELWITDLETGKRCITGHGCDENFVEQFTRRVANKVSKQFNQSEPVLEAETGKLRISCVHKSVAVTGTSICIRKTPPFMRITAERALEQKYFTRPMMNLLINCVRAKMNFVFCGEPGVGKTECAKFFSQFINGTDRVITIEDNPELHYADINPGKDCVELKVNDRVFDYAKAIKTCLRQNPQWIMLSEARSKEVKFLLECWSTGICGFTTLHTDDVRKIPDRIENMMGSAVDSERLENDIFSFVNIGILLRKRKNTDGTVYRYIDQVCFFVREGNKNRTVMVVEDGQMLQETIKENGMEKRVFKRLPYEILKKMMYAGIENPLENPFEALEVSSKPPVEAYSQDSEEQSDEETDPEAREASENLDEGTADSGEEAPDEEARS